MKKLIWLLYGLSVELCEWLGLSVCLLPTDSTESLCPIYGNSIEAHRLSGHIAKERDSVHFRIKTVATTSMQKAIRHTMKRNRSPVLYNP